MCHNEYANTFDKYPSDGDEHEFYDLNLDEIESIQQYNNSHYNETFAWIQSLMIQHINEACPIEAGECKIRKNFKNHETMLSLQFFQHKHQLHLLQHQIVLILH